MNEQEEPQLFGADHKGFHAFASALTGKIRELEEKERNYLIVSGQANEILTSMIESYVYSAVNLLLKQRTTEDQS